MRTLTVIHASDLHFGKLHDAVAAEAFLAEALALAPDLIAISGDFTQRAKIREYREAREYLDRLPDVPMVVTPGNHDVPLYRVWERVFDPFRNYREHLNAELNTVTRVPGLTAIGLCSAAPHRAIVNGRLTREQVAFARSACRDAPTGDLRVVVTHHHLAPAPDYEGDRPLPRAREILDAFEGMGVDVVLGGHLHRAYIGNSLDVYPGADRERGLVVVQSGTTTSKRGRARERAKCSFNLLRVFDGRLEITHYLYFREAEGFAPLSLHVFPRSPHRWFSPEIQLDFGTRERAPEPKSPAGTEVGP